MSSNLKNTEVSLDETTNIAPADAAQIMRLAAFCANEFAAHIRSGEPHRGINARALGKYLALATKPHALRASMARALDEEEAAEALEKEEATANAKGAPAS